MHLAQLIHLCDEFGRRLSHEWRTERVRRGARVAGGRRVGVDEGIERPLRSVLSTQSRRLSAIPACKLGHAYQMFRIRRKINTEAPS